MTCFRIKIHVAASVGWLVKVVKPKANESSSGRSHATLRHTEILL